MKSKKSIFLKVSLLCTLGLFLVSGKVMAENYGQQEKYQQKQQEQQKYQKYQQQQQQKTDFSDEKLDQFAKAYDQVQNIQQTYTDKMKQINNKKKAKELQDKYRQKMIKVIRNQDLTVSEYNQIFKAMKNNPEIKDKVQNR